MKKLALLLCILFFSLVVRADTLSSCGEIRATGSYVLNQSLASNGTCITIPGSHDNSTIDCNGFSILGAQDGIGIYSLSNSVTIRNCYINGTGIGIFVQGNDAYIVNNTIVDAKIGIKSNGGNTTLSNNSVINRITGLNDGNAPFPKIMLLSTSSSLFVWLANVSSADSNASVLVSACSNSAEQPPPRANIGIKRSDKRVWRENSAIYSPYELDVYGIGDSLTASFGYQVTLDRRMGSDSRRHNFGIQGLLCSEVYASYARSGILNGNNTVIISLCGVNDAYFGHPPEETESYIEAIYNISLMKKNSLVMGTVTPTNLPASDYCPKVLVINAWLRNFTKAHNIPLFDSYYAMWNGTDCFMNPNLTKDGLHPNEAGYVVLADTIWHQAFNSRAQFEVNKTLSASDRGRTYVVRCNQADGSTLVAYYELPQDFPASGWVSGNASDIAAIGLQSVSATLNGTGFSESLIYSGVLPVRIESGGLPIFEFSLNFSLSGVDFDEIRITNKTEEGISLFAVTGIDWTGIVGEETARIYGANPAYAAVCFYEAKDEIQVVQCDSELHEGYSCNISGTNLTVSRYKRSGSLIFGQCQKRIDLSGFIIPGAAVILLAIAYFVYSRKKKNKK